MPRTESRPLGREYHLPLDDVVLNVREWGAERADLTVVLTHGWTLSGRIWEDVAAMLVRADPTVRVIAYDHRGHGGSDVGPACIEALADDLAGVVEALVPMGPIVFGGHSLGGMTVMALAERHPELVANRAAAAAFVTTSAGDLLGAIRRFRGVDALLLAALLLVARVRTPSRPLFLARQGARRAFGTHPRRHDLNRAVSQTARAHPGTVADLGRSILRHSRYDALSAFRDIDVVVLAGTRDKLTSPLHASRIAERLPRSRVVVYDDAGHFLPYERREAVTTHLLDLIAKARAFEESRASVVG